jgi:hypothetical protein
LEPGSTWDRPTVVPGTFVRNSPQPISSSSYMGVNPRTSWYHFEAALKSVTLMAQVVSVL